MLRRIVASILILAILGYGSAWAFAGPEVGANTHLSAAAHGVPTDADHASTSCDHICHASAHMVGLHQEPPTLGVVVAERFVRHTGGSISTPPLPLPLKPPRS